MDSVVAVAALRLHDTLLPARFAPIVETWLIAARDRLDPATGLLPHRVDLRASRSRFLHPAKLVQIVPQMARGEEVAPYVLPRRRPHARHLLWVL